MKTQKNKEERMCSICFDEITNNTIYITKCKHIFHIYCIRKWNKNNCPMCRSNI